MVKLPEGREPLLWKDMPFSERPKAHPSTERLEIDKLKERVAELEAWQEAAFIVHGNIDLDIDEHPEARAALKGQDDE